MTSQGNATFSVDGKELEFPLVPAVEGETVPAGTVPATQEPAPADDSAQGDLF